MENTSDSFMPRPLLFCLKSERSVCYSVPDNRGEKSRSTKSIFILKSRKSIEESKKKYRKRVDTHGTV